MAIAEGITTALVQNELMAIDEPVTLGTDGISIPYDVADDGKILLMVENTGGAAETVTVRQGNGLQGVRDYVAAVPAGAVWYGVFESGAFANVKGEQAGKMIITGSTALRAGAVALPF